MKHVEIFTDGACSGNPGPGGYGAILRYGEHVKELSGGAPETTNNRMELCGVIEALKRLKEPCKVTVTTDSQYVCNGIEKGWAKNWKAKGWKRAGNEPVANPEMWDELLALTDVHEVHFQWVRGHDGHHENERCDQLAVAAAAKYKQP